jgi:phenylacetate-CoA ligase
MLSESQYYASGRIVEHQGRWLTALLRHCHSNIAWYSRAFRRFGVNPSADDPFSELTKLPILTKDVVRANHGDFCLAGAGRTALRFATSGTSGEPMVAYTSRNQWLYEQAAIWRQWKWAGYRFRDPVAIFRSYSPEAGRPSFKVDRLRNWAYFSVFRMSDEDIAQYARYLAEWKPRFLRGYPSSLLVVARHAIRYKWRLPSLVGAFTASEMVTPEVRDAVREAFGVQIFDHYGQAEITCMFHECEAHSGLHVDWEYGLVELGESAGAECFPIIATNLHNFAMPLLRYDTGDLSMGRWHQCTCGRVAPVVRGIRGRRDDYIEMSGGALVSTVNLYTFFSKKVELKQFQLKQYAPGRLTVAVAFWSGTALPKQRELALSWASQIHAFSGLIVDFVGEEGIERSFQGKTPAFLKRIAK